ncbi:MAG: hypothetical protein HY225_01650 [Candidatus Vogelbacteria bacterium]|nr:hypothetical protein [Candidatus Vogelbacteria bacterium]
MENNICEAEEKEVFWSWLFYASFLLPLSVFLLAIVTCFKLSVFLLLAFFVSNYFISKKRTHHRDIILTHRLETDRKFENDRLARKSDEAEQAFSSLSTREFNAVEGVLRSLLCGKEVRNNAELHDALNRVLNGYSVKGVDVKACALWSLYKSKGLANLNSILQNQIATVILFYYRHVAASHIRDTFTYGCLGGEGCCSTNDNRTNFYGNFGRSIKHMTDLTVEEFVAKHNIDLDVITQNDKHLIGAIAQTEK